MNFQQLEYILAIDKHRNFVKASQACFVTQPTLSAMVLKLEEELGVKIFDRSRHPVVTTSEGEVILDYAKEIVDKVAELTDVASRLNDEPEGDFRIGIIPTIATSLLPMFLSRFLKNHPGINLYISELTTASIIDKLNRDELDAGILATPVGSVSLIEYPVYREEFLLYGKGDLHTASKVDISSLDLSKLWLLEEGHCLRMQVVNLCDMSRGEQLHPNLQYQAGSLESLRRLVDANGGYTVLPALATIDLTDDQKKNLHFFSGPVPARQISVVAVRPWSRKRHIELLANAIIDAVGESSIIQKQKLDIIAVPEHMELKGLLR